ncbi:MAG: hypothetical protein Hals2KO_02560 [Halioglobus sp.]
MRPREKMKTVRDFDKALKSWGFSVRERKALCKAWLTLQYGPKSESSKPDCGIIDPSNSDEEIVKLVAARLEKDSRIWGNSLRREIRR